MTRIAQLCMLSFALTGCLGTAGHLNLVRVTQSREKPNQLRAEFIASPDLHKYAGTSGVIFMHAYFCDRKNDYVFLANPNVFVDGVALKEHPGSAGFESPYSFYVALSGSSRAESNPQVHGFNLREHPEDICFFLTISINNLFRMYHSNVARIPRESIVGALVETE